MSIKTNLKDLKPARERYKKSVKLLSGGKINGECFPGGNITIYPWDHTIDDYMVSRARTGKTSNSMAFSLLPKLCNLNGCAVGNFLASEVSLVIMISRSVLTNDIIKINYECPSCHATGEGNLKIPDNLTKTGEKGEDWPGYDMITLPESGDVVKVKPLLVSEEMRVLDRSESERKVLNDIIFRLSMVVKEVGGGVPENPAEIVTWLQALSPDDLSYLRDKFNELQPGLSNEVSIKCDGCSKEFKHYLSLDVDFFRRGGPPRA